MSQDTQYQPSTILSKDIANIKQVIDFQSIKQPLVAVYCGSRMGNNPIYERVATELGEAIAKANLGLVYGGACVGLMGAVADGVLRENGTVVGVIPEFMLDKELAHQGLTRLHLTDTMHTRKAVMAEYASAFVTLAGGLGTLEEIMEMATWRQLYQHEKPMIILNTDNFYYHMITHLKCVVKEGFMKPEDFDRLIVCDTVAQVISLLTPIVKIKDDIDVGKF